MAEEFESSSVPEEQPEMQYSGPYLGDVRDPEPIRNLIHATLDKLEETQIRAELEDAREAHRQLVDPLLRGDKIVSDEELATASERLRRAQAAARDSTQQLPEQQ